MARTIEQYSLEELEIALMRKRQAWRERRLARLQAEGRVMAVPPPTPAAPEPATLKDTPQPPPTGEAEPDGVRDAPAEKSGRKWLAVRWRWVADRALLLLEIGALVGLVGVIVALFASVRELNADAAALAAEQSVPASVAEADVAGDPVIDLVVLPGGHRPPVAGQPIVYEEAGFIPNHLLPLIDAYVPPAQPTPSPAQPRQVRIPSIEVNAPVVQGHEPEQLKKGVGHAIGSGLPGQTGNLVLSAHNDIYGEIFRHLDKLTPGDEVIVSTGRESYTYVINEIFTVDPTEVEVMAPTDHASLTLISCYPYLINNKRIIVKADLVDDGGGRDG